MVHCVILYNMNILNIYSGTPQNQNLSKPEFPRNPTIFSFYFHCIKILVNRNSSIPETGQAFYIISKRFQHYFTPLDRTTFRLFILIEMIVVKHVICPNTSNMKG